MPLAAESMPGRIGYALLVSLLIHAILLQAFERGIPNAPDQPRGEGLALLPMNARLQLHPAAPGPLIAVGHAVSAEQVEPTASTGREAGYAAESPESGSGDRRLYYFKASELDRRPFPLEWIEIPAPETPQGASVHLRLLISEAGHVDHASIVMSTGLTELEQSALSVFSSTQFKPGYRGEIPVRSELMIEVNLAPATAPGQSRLR